MNEMKKLINGEPTEFSRITTIPVSTLENWQGKTRPAPWAVMMIKFYLKWFRLIPAYKDAFFALRMLVYAIDNKGHDEIAETLARDSRPAIAKIEELTKQKEK